MSAVHQIRLQGPWQVVPPGGDPHAAPIEVKIPAPWRELFEDQPGIALFRRAFNAPTNLAQTDRLRIRLPDQAGRIEGCSLNGLILSPDPDDSLSYEVTNHLNEFNRLEIRIEWAPGMTSNAAGGLWQPVMLEIESADNEQ